MKYILPAFFFFINISVLAQDVSQTLKVGNDVPTFELVDDSNNVINSDIFEDKLILIDFWASYCGPCRQHYKTFLGPLYKLLKDSDFEIVGISLDKNVETWYEAIENDELAWPQLSATMNSNTVLEEFGVSYIPQTVLVDQNGKIIGLDLSKYELIEQIYQHARGLDVSLESLEKLASSYVSWEEFWIDIDYEVKKYLYDNTNYPEEAKKNNITGCIPYLIRIGQDFRLEFMASLEFVPGSDNTIKVEQLGHGCEEEALRVIKTMNKWRTWPYVQRINTYSLTIDVCFPPEPPVRKRIEDFKYN